MTVTIDPLVSLTLRMLFVVLFVTAAVHKLADFQGFRVTLRKYLRGAPWIERNAVAAVTGAVIVLGEGGLAAAVALSSKSVVGYALAALLVGYAAAMYFNLRRGNRLLDCGCSWGSSRQPVTQSLVMRNLGLAALGLMTTLPVGPRPLMGVDLFSAFAATVAAAALYSGLNLLIALHATHPEAQ